MYVRIDNPIIDTLIIGSIAPTIGHSSRVFLLIFVEPSPSYSVGGTSIHKVKVFWLETQFAADKLGFPIISLQYFGNGQKSLQTSDASKP